MFLEVLFSLFLGELILAEPFFSVRDKIAHVFDDELTKYLPICADSIELNVISKICAQQGGLRVKSYNKTFQVSILSSNVKCDINGCKSLRIFSCNHGLRVECDTDLRTFGCPLGFVKLERYKCIGIVDNDSQDYGGAASSCNQYQNSSLASLDFADIKILYLKLKELNKTRIDVHPFITSAVRIQKNWRWSNGVQVEGTPEGSGRCLAIQLSGGTVSFSGMDCTLKQFVPLCEINLTQNCVLPGDYHGTLSRTISVVCTVCSGSECMKWNDHRITRNGYFSSKQKLWDHNYCRIVNGNGQRPWCMISDQVFEECQVYPCNIEEHSAASDNDVSISSRKCKQDEVKCGQSKECVAVEFICDYEMDCSNGFDENNCPDFLEDFDLMGEFKLIDEVSEVWSNIRHVQGCAQRCIQNVDFICESFSFDPEKEICFLSHISNNPTVLFERSDSFYYQKKFSKGILAFSQNITSFVIEVTKEGQKAPVCVDNITQTDQLCKEFGYGPALNYPILLPPSTYKIWLVEGLRCDKCNPSQSSTCHRFLRCSNCLPTQFTCQLKPECIEQHKVCDGQVDCIDASDEIGCQNIAWRLHGEVEGLVSEGRVQLAFQNKWTDVCSDGLNEADVNSLCSKLGKGTYGRILPIYEQKPTPTTWLIGCTNGDCGPLRMHKCINGILNLRCGNSDSLYCGHRFSKTRNKRVVGGFDSAMGAFPWTAALRFNYGDTHHCGAVVIAQNYLLSAAHCFEANKEPKDFTVITGDWNNRVKEGTEQKFNITKIHFFPNYEDLFQHDIVILETMTKIKFDQYTQPVCLPPRGYRYNKGQVCIVSGWGSNGTEYSDTMKAAAMPILDREECRNVSKLYSSVSKTSFCAGYLSGGVDSCQGDSGGPFACEHDGIFYVGGIISWGDGCAQRKQPGIYTMVTPYLSWIENVTMISVLQP